MRLNRGGVFGEQYNWRAEAGASGTLRAPMLGCLGSFDLYLYTLGAYIIIYIYIYIYILACCTLRAPMLGCLGSFDLYICIHWVLTYIYMCVFWLVGRTVCMASAGADGTLRAPFHSRLVSF